MKKSFFLLCTFFSGILFSQTLMVSTNTVAEQVMLGKYDPALYKATTVLNHPDTIVRGLNKRISPDSLKSTIIKLSTFHNRNSGSDTVSGKRGIGAARRWIYSRFQQYGTANQNRLIPSYLQFKINMCGSLQHRDIFAVLPGLDTTDKSIIIIEGHVDSRCEDVCDTLCKAEGIEDNASGTALVMELARVMSKYSYARTIVFIVTIGEEQGLYGAAAFANYASAKGIKIKAVLNNDVIGGVICGKTSSPPSCPGLNNIDSTHVRLFSYGSFNSIYKGLSRFIKLEYAEELKPISTVPMSILVMSPEDRTGRSGDHIPFRQKNFAATRFTSANEHGDAGVTVAGYSDRQHTTRDTLGVSRAGNSVIDSFFVSFPYLARNAAINGNAAGMLGIGPQKPDFLLTAVGGNAIRVQVTQQTQYKKYRIGVRTTTNDWDSVYTMTNSLVDTIRNIPAGVCDVSVMSVDTNGIESLPSTEYTVTLVSVKELSEAQKNVQLLQNRPNPFDEATYISVMVNKKFNYGKAYILVKDIKGAEVQRLPVILNEGMNEVLFRHGYNYSGVYFYTLIIDDKPVESREMIFAN